MGVNKFLTVAFAVILGFAFMSLAPQASADQITLGASSQSITYTSAGGGDITVSIPAASPSGNAFFDSDALGTYSLGSSSFTAGPQASSLFPAGANSESFSFTGGDGDTVSGSISWSTIQDNTPQPKFFGTMTISSSSGDAAFLASFPNVSGTQVQIDLISNTLSGGFTLDSLAASSSGTSSSATISSGEVPGVPEPNALVLVGLGLVALCFWMRGKYNPDDLN